MNTATRVLIEQVKQAHERGGEFGKLLDPDSRDILGLTPVEEVVLEGLLLAEGNVSSAYVLVCNILLWPRFSRGLNSLEDRELISVKDGQANLDRVAVALRMQTPDEVEQIEGEPPSTKLVLRPLRQQVVMLAREAKTPAAGLGRVFFFIFGRKPQGKDYGLLGLLANELGVDQAALLLLDNAANDSPTLLHDLIPVAKARARGFRPNAQEEADERARYEWSLHQAAAEQRKRLGLED